MKTMFVWVLVVVLMVGLLRALDPAGDGVVELKYSEFTRLLALSDGSMKEAEDTSAVIEEVQVTLSGLRANLMGSVKDSRYLEEVLEEGEPVESPEFTVVLPFVDSHMLSSWENRGFSVSFKEQEVSFWEILLSGWPVLLLIAFWFFMFRNMQGGQKGMFSFGKSRAKLHNKTKTSVTFDDVSGAEEAKDELAEVVDFLKKPEKYQRVGGKIPKGILLLGQPGTGKTLLAKAVAGEADVAFYSISGSDFVEMFVGVGASRVRNLFEEAKKNSPSIVFIDEIDAVGRQRGAGLGGGHDEREQTLNQMLVEMDGFEQNSGIILIAATNRPDVLDPALLRPGRFDRQIVVDSPDLRGRQGILAVHTKKIPLGDDVCLQTIARGTPGFSGADLANLVNEAALLAARFDQAKVTMLDFEEARDKILMGMERNSKILTEYEKKTTAYHEAGHAICTLHCAHADPLHKVTIIPRGRALGVTFSLPDEDKHSYSRDYMLDRICVAMGGRVAELLVFQQMTTGASNDIKQATDMARKMVCDYGMSELGPVAYGKNDEQVFLGKDISRQRDFSERTAERIDEIIRKIIEEQEKRVYDIFETHRDELDCLAEALIEHEHLDKEEIDMVLRGEKITVSKKSRMARIFSLRKRRESEAEKDRDSGQYASEEDRNSKAEDISDSEDLPSDDSK
ncbi:ATP-dependent zinc metalloprotease FtsH [Chitinivibrio alkaliphilus]